MGGGFLGDGGFGGSFEEVRELFGEGGGSGAEDGGAGDGEEGCVGGDGGGGDWEGVLVVAGYRRSEGCEGMVVQVVSFELRGRGLV